MEDRDLRRRLNEAVEQHGAWTAHTIRLSDGVYTADEQGDFAGRLRHNGQHLKRIVQVAADLCGKPLAECRVLDLACLEGLYGIEFARHGAEVVAIEGREASAAKARFTKEALGLDNYTIQVGDVRELSLERHGRFDIILCLGILYHLDAPDVFRLIEVMGELCDRVVIIDTHVVTWARRRYEHRGRHYSGKRVIEHLPWISAANRAKKLWASLDNPRALWLTRSSLANLLTRAGFTSAYVCETPALEGWRLKGRETIAAVKGQPVRLESTPMVNDEPPVEADEKTPRRFAGALVGRWKGSVTAVVRIWKSARRRK